MLWCKGTGINNVLGVYQGMYGINVKVGLMAVVMAIVSRSGTMRFEVCRLVGCLVGVLIGCLVGVLIGCLVGCLVSRLVAWLAGWLVSEVLVCRNVATLHVHCFIFNYACFQM